MKDDQRLQNILLTSGCIGVLLLALVFDLVIRALAQRNAELGGLDATLVWLFPLMQFVWSLAVLALVWMMIAGGGYSRLVSVFYLIVGLVLLYTNSLLFVNEFPDSIYVVVEYLTPGTLLFQAAAAVTAIGLLSLWFWKPPVLAPEEAALDVSPQEPE